MRCFCLHPLFPTYYQIHSTPFHSFGNSERQLKTKSNCHHLYYQYLDKVHWKKASNSYTTQFRTFVLNGIISTNVGVGKQLKMKSVKSPSSQNWLRHRLAIPSSPRCTAIESASISEPRKRQALFVVPAFCQFITCAAFQNGASANSFHATQSLELYYSATSYCFFWNWYCWYDRSWHRPFSANSMISCHPYANDASKPCRTVVLSE